MVRCWLLCGAYEQQTKTGDTCRLAMERVDAGRAQMQGAGAGAGADSQRRKQTARYLV